MKKRKIRVLRPEVHTNCRMYCMIMFPRLIKIKKVNYYLKGFGIIAREYIICIPKIMKL